MVWMFRQIPKELPRLNAPIFIEGLPGIGNVGKVAIDFMIEELKAKKLYDVFSHSFPHSVFVNEENLVELPTIEIYYKKMPGSNDLLFLAGDVQPVDEVSSYEFCEKILDIAQKFNSSEIITFGGIGMQTIPKDPIVYCTGNCKKIIEKYKKSVALNDKLYGVVGPIVGVSGLLLGLAKKRNIDAISLLAETFGHPLYLGIKGAREILEIMDIKLSLGMDINKLNKEIAELEKEMQQKTGDFTATTKNKSFKGLHTGIYKDTSYIG